MITIQIAGAGAGKTYGLAESILEMHDALKGSHKKIYGVTFTNSARREIENALIKQAGEIPKNVVVCTIHTFLLDEIIYPYNSYVFGEYYVKSTTSKLPKKQAHRSWKVGQLKELNILHIEETYKAARRVVDRSMSTHNTKLKKAKVANVLTHIESDIACIFLDEAQDLDQYGLSVFEALANNTNIKLSVIGDPKQALKFPNSLSDFLSRYPASDIEKNIEVKPSNNVSRRLPADVLKLSNLYCYTGQEQTTISPEQGSLLYIEATDSGYYEYLVDNIENENIVCIDKKKEGYDTGKKGRSCLDAEIEIILEKKYPSLDSELVIEAAKTKFFKHVTEFGDNKAANNFLVNHGIGFEKKIWAMLMGSISTKSESLFVVSSIQAVKGLEANTCVLVLTPNTLNYLIRENLEPDKQFNKEWKQMYVAITRTKKEFVLAVDSSLFSSEKYDVSNIKEAIENLGFNKLTLSS